MSSDRRTGVAERRAPTPNVPVPVDEILGWIVRLLEHESSEKRVAAAVVLGELRPRDERTLEALRRALARADDAPLRRAAAEALGAIAPDTIVQDLEALLRDPDRRVQSAVHRILASGETVREDDLIHMLGERNDRQRLGAIAVLGARGGRSARLALLMQLRQGDIRVLDAVMDALTPSIKEAEVSELGTILDDIETSIDKDLLREDPSYAIAVIQLIAHVKDGASALLLMKLIQAAVEVEVVVAAVDAVRKILVGRRVPVEVHRFLLDMAESERTAHEVISTVAETLGQMDLPVTLEPRARALLEGSRWPAIRHWAARALGGLDTAPAARSLAKVVADGEPADRDAALEVIVTTKSGLIELARLLAEATDVTKAERYAAALRGHESSLLDQSVWALETAVAEASPPVAQVIVDLLDRRGGRGGEARPRGVLDRALEFKKKGKWEEAADLLRRLNQGRHADPEARYQCAVCELKTSKRVLSRGSSKDPCVTALGEVLKAKDFPVLDRLKDEKCLGAEELYYLGFALTSGDDLQQGLGADILAFVADSGTDTKLTKMARNRLQTMGLGE